MCSKGLHKEAEANYMTSDKQIKCPEDDLVLICFYLLCPLSLPNFKFHVLQAGDNKRRRGCAVPAAGKAGIGTGARYTELEGDWPLPRGNQNESVSVPLTSGKQHWNDIVTFFFLVVLEMSGGI